jgi:translation initiation factor IF-1
MAKEEMLEFEGVVDEVLPDARCRVTVEMTPYDLTKGRINFRHKDVRPGQGDGGAGGGSRPGGPSRRPGGR